MPLSYRALVKLVEDGIIRGVHPDRINGASIDLTLAPTLLIEDEFAAMAHALRGHRTRTISLRDREPLKTYPQVMGDAGYGMIPGEFLLAATNETFYLPGNICAEYKEKSSMARIGLGHLLAGWADPWWNDSALTLELQNVTRYHTILLHTNDLIGQMIFWDIEEVEKEKGYGVRGRYNGDRFVQGIKP